MLTTFPGYTLSSLLDEDAYELMQLRALLDPDIGKAKDDVG